jgi:hypothetical protein
MSLWQIFRWPLAIGVLTLTGLIAGLVSDSWGDLLAAVGLFVPAAVCAWHGLRRQPGQQASVEADAEMNTNPT